MDHFLKMGYSQNKKKSLPLGANSFLLKWTIFQKRGNNNYADLSTLKVFPFPLKHNRNYLLLLQLKSCTLRYPGITNNTKGKHSDSLREPKLWSGRHIQDGCAYEFTN